MVASKTVVSDVCGKEHSTVGMGVVTGELPRHEPKLLHVESARKTIRFVLRMMAVQQQQ